MYYLNGIPGSDIKKLSFLAMDPNDWEAVQGVVHGYAVKLFQSIDVSNAQTARLPLPMLGRSTFLRRVVHLAKQKAEPDVDIWLFFLHHAAHDYCGGVDE